MKRTTTTMMTATTAAAAAATTTATATTTKTKEILSLYLHTNNQTVHKNWTHVTLCHTPIRITRSICLIYCWSQSTFFVSHWINISRIPRQINKHKNNDDRNQNKNIRVEWSIRTKNKLHTKNCFFLFLKICFRSFLFSVTLSQLFLSFYLTNVNDSPFCHQ